MAQQESILHAKKNYLESSSHDPAANALTSSKILLMEERTKTFGQEQRKASVVPWHEVWGNDSVTIEYKRDEDEEEDSEREESCNYRFSWQKGC